MVAGPLPPCIRACVGPMLVPKCNDSIIHYFPFVLIIFFRPFLRPLFSAPVGIHPLFPFRRHWVTGIKPRSKFMGGWVGGASPFEIYGSAPIDLSFLLSYHPSESGTDAEISKGGGSTTRQSQSWQGVWERQQWRSHGGAVPPPNQRAAPPPTRVIERKNPVARRGSRKYFWGANSRIFPYFENISKLSTNNYEIIQIYTYIL